MSIDDPTGGGHQAGGVIPERGQGLGGLAHQHALIGSRRSGDVAEPFDRVHPADATGASEARLPDHEVEHGEGEDGGDLPSPLHLHLGALVAGSRLPLGGEQPP